MTYNQFEEYFESLTTKDQVYLWDEYAREYDYDNEIFVNDEEFFNTYFGNDVMKAVLATQYGNYKYNHEFTWFNNVYNLDSSDDIDDMPIDIKVLYEYIDKHPEVLDNYPIPDFYDEEEDQDDEEDND